MLQDLKHKHYTLKENGRHFIAYQYFARRPVTDHRIKSCYKCRQSGKVVLRKPPKGMFLVVSGLVTPYGMIQVCEGHYVVTSIDTKRACVLDQKEFTDKYEEIMDE